MECDPSDISVTDDESMKEAAEIAGVALQQIQNYLGDLRNNKKVGKVKFPRGYIRPAAFYRSKIRCIDDETLKKNLSYNLMFADVMRWLANRTDLYGIAKDMLTKQGVVLYGAIVESVLHHVCAGVIGKRHKFKERCKRMVAAGIIEESLEEELNWLWEIRNNQHMFLLTFSEHEHYSVSDWNRAVKAFADLVDQVESWKGK